MTNKTKISFIFIFIAATACVFSFAGTKAEKYNDSRLPKPTTNSDFYGNGNPGQVKVELGRLLFFDKILSGNKNISCATCHHPLTNTVDGLSLPVGEGGHGLGIARDTGSGSDVIKKRTPRNTLDLFNRGAREFSRMTYDGRMAVDPSQPSGFRSPAGGDLPAGLDNVLSVQVMISAKSGPDLAGQAGENSIADAAARGEFKRVWEALAKRLRAIPEYVELFTVAYPDVARAEDITYVHVANAIAAFEAVAWRADNTPFDLFLRGEKDAMSEAQKRGMKLFYGKAGCYACHSGTFQTDQKFHAIAMPQIGPGKGDGLSGHEDYGREKVTGDSADRYKFRTPSLRNVTLTAPYGHDGAYNTLEAVVRHHLNPVESLKSYDTNQAVLPSSTDLDTVDFIVQNDPKARQAITDANELDPLRLTEQEVKDLIGFFQALTDPATLDLRADMPEKVPSGLSLAD